MNEVVHQEQAQERVEIKAVKVAALRYEDEELKAKQKKIVDDFKASNSEYRRIDRQRAEIAEEIESYESGGFRQAVMEFKV